MDRNDVIDRLNDLIKLDIDASRAYGQALDNIDHPDIKSHMTRYRDDHDRHVTELQAAVRGLGGSPAEMTPDIKGYFIEGFTALRSMTGTEGALKAMQTNERLTNSRYQDAVKELAGAPAEVMTLLDRNYADERLHLEYVTRALDTRAWEARRPETGRGETAGL